MEGDGRWECLRRECLLLPAIFLTKIWIVSVASDDDDEIDDSEDTLLDRLIRMVIV